MTSDFSDVVQASAGNSQFLLLLIRTVCFYGLHLAALLGGFVWLHRRARLKLPPPAAPLAVALALGSLLTFAVSEPQAEWFGDFVEAYYAGGAAALKGLDEVPKAFDRGVHGFVNIPLLAVPFAPFALLPPMVAALAYLILGIVAIIYTWRTLVVELKLDVYTAAMLGLLIALNGPLLNSLREGNTSHFALLAASLALFRLRRQQDLSAGLLLGAATLFKLPLLLFGVYFVVRARLRAALGIAVVLGAVGALSILLFGWSAHVHWYERFVAGAGEKPIGAFNVQSVPALLLRFERAGEVICNWAGLPLSASARYAATGISLTMIGSVAAAVLLPLRLRGQARPTSPGELDVEFVCILVLACLLSPLAWSHYYCWMLLPLALMLVAQPPPPAGPRRIWLVLATVAVSLPVLRPWCSPSGFVQVPYLIALSHYLLGGVLVLALLVAWRFRRGMLP